MKNQKKSLGQIAIMVVVFLTIYLVSYFTFNLMGLVKEPKLVNEYRAISEELKLVQGKLGVLSENSSQNKIEEEKKNIEDLKNEIKLLQEKIDEINLSNN